MTSLEFRALPQRLTDAERDQALGQLRESAAQGQVSHETFANRMEIILGAQRPEELHAALYDVRQPRQDSAMVRAVGRVSSLRGRMRRAWTREDDLPELLLPAAGPYALSIGRAPGSVLRLTDYTVSRAHAQVRYTGQGWTLRDLGSSNGTWVNDRRIAGSVPVRPGDRVRFGTVGFQLTAP